MTPAGGWRSASRTVDMLTLGRGAVAAGPILYTMACSRPKGLTWAVRTSVSLGVAPASSWVRGELHRPAAVSRSLTASERARWSGSTQQVCEANATACRSAGGRAECRRASEHRRSRSCSRGSGTCPRSPARSSTRGKSPSPPCTYWACALHAHGGVAYGAVVPRRP